MFVGPDRLSKKSGDFLGIWTSIRQPLVKGNRQNTSKQTTRINHPTSLLRRGCKPAIKEQPSDTIFSSQCMQNTHRKSSAKPYLFRMRSFSLTAAPAICDGLACAGALQLPDAQKVVRLFGQAIWPDKMQRRPVGLAKPDGLEPI